jgi:hypothetical protein
MKRFEVPLSIEVVAEDADAAFEEVRSHYCVINDPNNEVKTEGTHTEVDFVIGDTDLHELAEDESVCD